MKTLLINLVLVASLLVTVSCEEKKNEETVPDKEMKSETQMKEYKQEKLDSPLVREGIIDVVEVDINKDGHVYECPMDWNVLDDKAGDCPVCGMKLKEYTIVDVQKNLSKFGFEYKK